MNTLKKLKLDFQVYGMRRRDLLYGLFTTHNFYLVFLYRLSHFFYYRGWKGTAQWIRAIGKRKYAADISPAATIGCGFRIIHSPGIVIGDDIKMGNYCEVFQNVTLGGKDGKSPLIGNRCTFFAGSVVIGGIYVDNDTQVGTNAVLLQDTDKGSIMVGVPAKKIGTVKIPHTIQSLEMYQTTAFLKRVWSSYNADV